MIWHSEVHAPLPSALNLICVLSRHLPTIGARCERLPEIIYRNSKERVSTTASDGRSVCRSPSKHAVSRETGVTCRRFAACQREVMNRTKMECVGTVDLISLLAPPEIKVNFHLHRWLNHCILGRAGHNH